MIDDLFLEHPWVSEGRKGPIKLDFKGSGCDHEASGVLGANKFAKQKFLHQIWPLLGYPECILLVVWYFFMVILSIQYSTLSFHFSGFEVKVAHQA